MNAELKTFIDSLALTYNVTFVPQSASRNSTEKNPSLNWRVSIARPQRSTANIATDYMQGIAHVPGYVHTIGRLTVTQAEAYREQHRAAELGTYPQARNGKLCSYLPRKPLSAPNIADVLHSLVLDGDAANRSFDDWCSELGLDTDSRKAERMYDACRDIGRQLQRMFTHDELARLQELFQDY